MANHEDRIEPLMDPSKRNMDRNRGLQLKSFSEALVRASANAENATDDVEKQDHCPDNSDQ